MSKNLLRKIKAIAAVTIVVIGIFAGAIASVTVLSGTASAITENDLLFKALVGGMRECYRTGKMVNPIDPSKYYTYQDAIADKSSDFIVLPTLVGNSVASSKATCLQIFSGIRTGGFLGIGTTHALTGLTEIGGDKLAMDYKNLGYVEETQESEESPIKCLHLEYQYTAPGSNRSVTATSNRFCFPVDSSGIVNIVNPNTDIIVEPAPTENGKIELAYRDTTMTIQYRTVGGWGNDQWREFAALYQQPYDNVQQQAIDNLNALDFYNEGFYAIGSVGDPFDANEYKVTATTPAKVWKSDYGESTYTAMTFRNGAPLNGSVDALRYFTGNPDAGFGDGTYKFVNDDWITLYKIYFQRIAGQNAQLRVTENCSTDNSGYTYAWFDGRQWCELSGVESVTGQFGWRKDMFTLQLVSFADMTKSYMTLNFGNFTQEELDPDTPATDPNSPDQIYPGGVTTNRLTNICLNAAAAESASWIVCPAMGGMAEGNDGIYGAVKKLLDVDPALVSGNGGPAYEIWGFFRNFANVVFAILILAIIFSQVTGVGIDNYGIQKTLPRLIITAVLVNLSFIISQLAVDISNVVGNGLSLMLSSWANTAFDYNGDGIGFMTIIEGIFFAGGATGATAAPIIITGITAGVTSWWLVLLIVGIVLAIVGIAALIFYLMLAARQILVIVAVVISPIAFICYTLPNTEKLFKKWWDILKATLLIYPICSFLCGIGQVIQSIVLGSSSAGLDKSMALIAAACPFIPFFALPALLKASLRAVGDLGTKISSIGTGARNLANKGNAAFRNTDTFKDAQFQTAMARNTKRLDKFKNADGTWKDDATLSDWQKRRKNLYQRRDLAFQKTNLERENLLNGGYDAATAAMKSAADKQALDNEITLMGTPTKNYDTDVMNDQLAVLLGKESLSSSDELRMKALMYKLATGGGYGKKLLAKTAAGASAGTRGAVSKFMSKNGDVASAISGKNAAAGQYLREVNSGRTNAKSFAEWKTAPRPGGNGINNMQFVWQEVVTKDEDFVGQSAGVVAEALGVRKNAATGQYEVDSSVPAASILDSGRLSDMVNDERLMHSADSEVRKAMFYAAQQNGIQIPDNVRNLGSDTGAASDSTSDGGAGGSQPSGGAPIPGDTIGDTDSAAPAGSPASPSPAPRSQVQGHLTSSPILNSAGFRIYTEGEGQEFLRNLHNNQSDQADHRRPGMPGQAG